MSTSTRRFLLLGAGDDTGNLGVSALHHSVVAGLARVTGAADIVAADHGLGTRRAVTHVDGAPFHYRVTGVRVSRRYWRPEAITTAMALARVGVRVPFIRFVDAAEAVLDIAGGDSFSDLYGQHRFHEVTWPREPAYQRGVPVVLLPQTYGPFRDPANLEVARRHVRDAAMAWARDADSFGALTELAGADFDPDRHRQGVDVAFALEPRSWPLPEPVTAFLDDTSTARVGFNVSGLVLNDPEAAAAYGLTIDYRRVVLDVLGRILDESDARVLLVPHVVVSGTVESDRAACEAIAAELDRPDRVLVAPNPPGPGEAKHLIAGCDWFCGTRMHATIAALSSGVPCASIAYSLKTRGVFASCGQADHVADARSLDDATAASIVHDSFRRRDEARIDLAERIPAVIEAARDQFGAIVALGDHPVA